jgi:Mg-chelatase subunit ChlD
MSLELAARLHQSAYLANQPQTLYALLEFKPGASLARLPLDLRLVLDTSGSMDWAAVAGVKGSKLALMRQAASAMIEGLALGDTVQVVSFDDQAHTLYAGCLTQDTDKKAVLRALKGLRTGGGTSILAGLEAALKEAPLPDRVARVVLVTDGQGEASEEAECARLAFAGRGKATWLVYGIGVDYNDGFLDGLANANGGQYVHLSSLEQASETFTSEAAVMGEIALTNLMVTIEPLDGVELVRADRIVPQLLPLSVHQPHFLSADLGDVDKARGQKLLLQFAVPARPAGNHGLARVRCGFHCPALKQLNVQRELLLTASFTLDAACLGPDGEVLRTVQLAGANRLYTLGLAEVAGGQGDAAIRTLGSAAGLYEHLGLAGVSDKLKTLTSSLSQAGAVDEEVKRTLTTMARQAWQPEDDHDALP